MKRLLLGLILAATTAWCTPLPPFTTMLYYPIHFDTPVDQVTSMETPEWARMMDMFAWWELRLGSFDSGGSPVTVYLRGVLRNTTPGVIIVQWLEYVPTIFTSGDPSSPSHTPESGTLGLVAGGLAAAALAKGRRRSPH